MNAKVILGFIGGVVVGAAAALLTAPDKGVDTRAKIISYLKEKGVTRDRFEEIIARVKDKLHAWSSMNDIEAAVDEALSESSNI